MRAIQTSSLVSSLMGEKTQTPLCSEWGESRHPGVLVTGNVVARLPDSDRRTPRSRMASPLSATIRMNPMWAGFHPVGAPAEGAVRRRITLAQQVYPKLSSGTGMGAGYLRERSVLRGFLQFVEQPVHEVLENGRLTSVLLLTM